MTKAEQERLVAWRLRILQHAEREPRYVAQTCRYFGISRMAWAMLRNETNYDPSLATG